MSSPKSSGSPSYKKVSSIYVAKLKKMKNKKFKIEMVNGADVRHSNFFWLLSGNIDSSKHDRYGLSRQEIQNTLLNLYPDRRYRVYYSHIIFLRILPRRLILD